MRRMARHGLTDDMLIIFLETITPNEALYQW